MSTDEVEKAVIESAIEYPAYGQVRQSNELKKRGVFISNSKNILFDSS